MTSLGPDWHDKTVPMLWRTWFAASTQPILLRMGPQTLKVPRDTFWFQRYGLRGAPHAKAPALWLEVSLRWTLRFRWSVVAAVGRIQGNDTTPYHRHIRDRCKHKHNTTRYPSTWKRMRTFVSLLFTVCIAFSSKTERWLQCTKCQNRTVHNTAETGNHVRLVHHIESVNNTPIAWRQLVLTYVTHM
jgi:hypothetical protein